MTLKSEFVEIELDQFQTRAVELWDQTWLLLTSGDFQEGRYNCMTVAWGSLGNMWNMPFAMVVVRPSRYTFEFINTYDSFTLCAFPPQYRQALSLLGSQSGRDGDKIAASGLTVCPAQHVAAPVFQEAELVIECRKIYWQDFDPEHFISEEIHKQYQQGDFHRMVFGRMLAIRGIKNKYSA